MGAVDVVGGALAALLVLDAAGLGLFGEFLGLLDTFGVGLDGVTLALQGAVQLDAGGVRVPKLEVVQGLVGVQHHLVVGAAAVGQVGLVGENGAGLGADLYLGLLLVAGDAAGGLVEGGDGAGQVGDARRNLVGRGGVQSLVGLGLAGLAERGGGRGGRRGGRCGNVGKGGGAEDGALLEAVEDGVLVVRVVLGVLVGLGDGGGEVAGADGLVALLGFGRVGLAAGEGENRGGGDGSQEVEFES